MFLLVIKNLKIKNPTNIVQIIPEELRTVECLSDSMNILYHKQKKRAPAPAVVDKTGLPATSQFGPFLHTLTAYVEMNQNVLVTGSPVFSTTTSTTVYTNTCSILCTKNAYSPYDA